VASGPGHVAAAFAEAGCEVVGLDLTAAPLELAERMRTERGLTSLSFQTGDAEHLPFAGQTFDIVVSRFALHHFENPQQVCAEMARVCQLQGTVVIQDLITSEFPTRAAYQNRFEQLRDPSHVRALPLSVLIDLFSACGLEITQVFTNYLTTPLEIWLQNAHTPPERASQVRTLLAQDEQQDLSGTRPFRQQETVYFHQHLATCVARRLN
jgi:ubiquinone/menaquinone biosynthesis C-methylase UbiE